MNVWSQRRVAELVSFYAVLATFSPHSTVPQRPLSALFGTLECDIHLESGFWKHSKEPLGSSHLLLCATADSLCGKQVNVMWHLLLPSTRRGGTFFLLVPYLQSYMRITCYLLHVRLYLYWDSSSKSQFLHIIYKQGHILIEADAYKSSHVQLSHKPERYERHRTDHYDRWKDTLPSISLSILRSTGFLRTTHLFRILFAEIFFGALFQEP
jgi:hypothetical protein